MTPEEVIFPLRRFNLPNETIQDLIVRIKIHGFGCVNIEREASACVADEIARQYDEQVRRLHPQKSSYLQAIQGRTTAEVIAKAIRNQK